MSNENRDDKLYKYPNSNVLRNIPDIKDAEALEIFERLATLKRIEEGTPEGKLDLGHLQAIHKHLFQDVFEWAGKIRLVDFHKGGQWFHPMNRIEMGMADVHKRLVKSDFLRNLNRENFSTGAGVIIGDINLVHPFREGNGRTQFQYLKQLAHQAGHNIDLTRFDGNEWITASIKANRADYEPMADCIYNSITEKTRISSKENAVAKAIAKSKTSGKNTAKKVIEDDHERER